MTPDLPPYSSSSGPFPLPIITFSPSGNAVAFLWMNTDGYHLCHIDLSPEDVLGPPKILYQSKRLVRAPVVSVDGMISVVASTERTGKQQYHLLAFDREGTQIGELYEGPEGSVEPIAFSPLPGDMRLLAATNQTGDKRPLLWNPRTGERTDLALPEIEGEVVPLSWSPDGSRILLCQFYQAVQQLYIYVLETQEVIKLNHPGGSFTFFGSLGTYFGPEGREVFAQWQDASQPTQLIALDADTGEKTRTVLAAGGAPGALPVRSVHFPSSDGQSIQAWLCVPEGEGPFPTILNVHGGPQAVVTESYGMGSAWAENGFAWISVNFRGSTTFGRDFQQKIWGDLGHWEIEDMVAARAWLVEQGISAPDKILVSGGSYGGYLTLLALGKRPDLWAGGIGTVAIADYALTWEDSSGLLQGITTALFSGTPQEKPEQYRISSPITYAEAVSAPLLVIQGRHDTRCPPRQMEVYEQKMKSLGKDIEVIWFDAGHGTGATGEAIVHMEQMLAFARRVVGQSTEA